MDTDKNNQQDLFKQVRRTLDAVNISIPKTSIQNRVVEQNGVGWFENYETSLTGFGLKLEFLQDVNSKAPPKNENLYILKNNDDCFIVDRRTDIKDGDVLDIKTGEKFKLNKFLKDFNSDFPDKIFKLVSPDEVSKGSFVDRIKSHWFWGVIWRNRSSYTQAGLASILINIFAIATAMFTMIVYNKIIPANAVDSLVVLVFGVLIILVTEHHFF